MYIPNKDLLKPNSLVRAFCKDIYGVGRERTILLLRLYGLFGNVTMRQVTQFFYKNLISYLDITFLTEKSLSNLIFEKLNLEKTLLSVRGFKLANNLPINGQRTHTNAGTPSRLGFNYYVTSNKERQKVRDSGRLLYLIQDSKERRQKLRKYFKKFKQKK